MWREEFSPLLLLVLIRGQGIPNTQQMSNFSLSAASALKQLFTTKKRMYDAVWLYRTENRGGGEEFI